MPVTRKLNNGYEVIDWTQDIINAPIRPNMLGAMDLFEMRSTSQTAIMFEQDFRDYTLLPQTSRSGRDASVGKDRSSKLFSLPLPYFKHKDAVYPSGLQDHREYGEMDTGRALARAIATKIEDMQIRAELTKEYMRWEAIKGITVDSEGNTIANMFTEFSVSQNTIDFALGTPTTDVVGKISELKRTLAANNRTGVALNNNIVVMVGNTFFDKLVNHSDVVQAYSYWAGVPNPLRDNLFDYRAYGAVATFNFEGVTFVNYSPSFVNKAGSTLTPIAAADGYTVLPGQRDLYRGYNGPSNKLSGANQPGSPLFLYQYPDPKDEVVELEEEMSPLFFMTAPTMSVKVTSST